MVASREDYKQVWGTYFRNIEFNKIYRVDFVYRGNCIIPPGSVLNVPGEAVNNLYIRNDGAAPIQFSVNAPNPTIMEGGVLAAGRDREFKWFFDNIKSVNIVAINDGINLFANVAIDVNK